MRDEIINTLINQLQEINFTGTLAPHMYGELWLIQKLLK